MIISNNMPKLLLAVLPCFAVALGPRLARAENCRNVHAEIDLGSGTISGNYGLLGSAAFLSDGNEKGPPTAPEKTSSFSGILTLTTDHGVLEMRETGVFSSRVGNPAGALLSSFGEVTRGTGRYRNATGDVFFTGTIVDGKLIVEMSGKLCR